jgi:hypothetical protein
LEAGSGCAAEFGLEATSGALAGSQSRIAFRGLHPVPLHSGWGKANGRARRNPRRNLVVLQLCKTLRGVGLSRWPKNSLALHSHQSIGSLPVRKTDGSEGAVFGVFLEVYGVCPGSRVGNAA